MQVMYQAAGLASLSMLVVQSALSSLQVGLKMPLAWKGAIDHIVLLYRRHHRDGYSFRR